MLQQVPDNDRKDHAAHGGAKATYGIREAETFVKPVRVCAYDGGEKNPACDL